MMSNGHVYESPKKAKSVSECSESSVRNRRARAELGGGILHRVVLRARRRALVARF